MKKKPALILISILAIIGCAGLVLPFYSGSRIHEAILEMADALSKQPGFSVKIENYERGWLNSRATLLATGEFPEKQEEIVWLDQEIKHGLTFTRPWFAKITTKPVFPAEIADKLAPYLQGKPLFQFTTTVYLGGDTRHDIYSPSFKGEEDNYKFDWQGLEGVFNISKSDKEPDAYLRELLELTGYSLQPAGGEMNGEIQAKSLVIDTGDVNLEISGIKLVWDLKSWDGHSNISIGKFNLAGINTDGNPFISDRIAFTNVSLEQISTDNKDVIDYDMRYHIDTFNTEEKEYKDIALGFKLKNISKEGFIKYLKLFKSYEKQIAENTDPEKTFDAEFISQLQSQVLGTIIKFDPEFNIPELGFSTDEGDLSGNLKLRYAGDSVFSDFNPLMDLAGEANVSAGEGLFKNLMLFVARQTIKEVAAEQSLTLTAEEIEELSRTSSEGDIQQLVQCGLIKKDGDIYSAQALLRPGELTINGLPVQQLLSPQ